MSMKQKIDDKAPETELNEKKYISSSKIVSDSHRRSMKF